MTAKQAENARLGVFERYLTLWVALCIVAGIVLGHFLPDLFQTIGKLEIAQVNLPVAVLIWLMIIPMLVKIDFAALRGVGQYWRGDRRHPADQLGNQAVLDGAARWVVRRRAVRAAAAGGADRVLHRRADPAGGRALHRDGVRVE